MTGPVAEFGHGVACFARGQMLVLRKPGLAGIAILPPLLISLVLFGLLALLATYAERLVTLATPFLNGQNAALAQGIRWVIAMALLIGFVYVAVQTFAILTLTLGRPLYMRIQRRVDRLCGGSHLQQPPEQQTQFRPGNELMNGALRSLAGGGGVFAVGLIPAAGEVAAPIVGAVIGASNIVVELIEPAFSARGIGRLEDRRQAVANHRASALGFGLLAYIALLLPFVGVVLFPGAVAGATLLTRRWCGEPADVAD